MLSFETYVFLSLRDNVDATTIFCDITNFRYTKKFIVEHASLKFKEGICTITYHDGPLCDDGLGLVGGARGSLIVRQDVPHIKDVVISTSDQK